ncbi:hypothetical protein TMEN_3460 [Trichophyton mentagrophytes]|nr:hypothetical protein TMEN_3460 [Trichophyton mentagrophytes]
MSKTVQYGTFPPPPPGSGEEGDSNIPEQGGVANTSQPSNSSAAQPQPRGDGEATEHTPGSQTGIPNPAQAGPSTEATEPSTELASQADVTSPAPAESSTEAMGRPSEPLDPTGITNPTQAETSLAATERPVEPVRQAEVTNPAPAESSTATESVSEPVAQTGTANPAQTEPSAGPHQLTEARVTQTEHSVAGGRSQMASAPRFMASGGIVSPTDCSSRQSGPEELRGRARHRGEQPRRFHTPEVGPGLALTGTHGEFAQLNPGDEPRSHRGILPNYLHPRPITAAQLPPCAAFRTLYNVTSPEFNAFLQKVLDDAFQAVCQRGPSTRRGERYPRPRRSPGCKAKCYFAHHRIIRDLDPGWLNELRDHRDDIPRDAEEDWFGRKSEHKDKRSHGNATFEDMRQYWKNGHTKYLPEYVPGIQVTKVHTYDCEDVQLINWRDVTAEICWIERHSGLCSSSKRIFPVMVLTAARAFNPEHLARPGDQLPTYEETADPRRPRQTYADVTPEGSPGHPANGNNASTEPSGSGISQPVSAETGSSGSFRTAAAEAGSSRNVLPKPNAEPSMSAPNIPGKAGRAESSVGATYPLRPASADAGDSSDVQPASTEAGSSRGFENTPTTTGNSRGVNSLQTTSAEAVSSRDTQSSSAEAGGSRGFQSTPATAGSSRDINTLQTTPDEAGSSRDIQSASNEAGNPENTDQSAQQRTPEEGSNPQVEPDPQHPSRGVPSGWLDSLFVVHLPLVHTCFGNQRRIHRIRRTIYPSYVSVGMVRQLPRLQTQRHGRFEWWFTVSARPQSRFLFPRWLKNLYIGMPHLIKDEPGEFMRMLTWRRYNPDIPRGRSLIRW